MDMVNLTCEAGDFDIVFHPAGAPSGYEDLAACLVLISVGDQDPRAASTASFHPGPPTRHITAVHQNL